MKKWPSLGGVALTPVLRLGPALLRTAGFEIADGVAVTVAVDLSRARDLDISDVGESARVRARDFPAVVVAHRATPRPLVDRAPPQLHGVSPCSFVLGPPVNDGRQSDRSELNACSKIGGRAGFIQDPIDVPECQFALQISGAMLAMAGAQSDPFRGGLGYLFLRKRIRPTAAAAGFFFTQSS
jgi:hypothetical protein